jgi:hypothetical protein
MRRLVLFLLLGLVCVGVAVKAQTSLNKIQGYAERGGYNVQTSPTIIHEVQGSYPNSTITVYQTGTTTLVSIFSDTAGSTPKSNPFTADSFAFYSFYIADGCYDIKFSGTGISSPFTQSRICVREQIIYTLSTATPTPTPTPAPPPINNLGSKTYYAREHGAVLDGSRTSGAGTNDTTAIQAILNLASSSQSIAMIIDGGIASVNQLKTYGNTHIKCTNGGGFSLRDGSNKTLLTNFNRTASSIVDKHIVIEGCFFYGNSTNQTGIGTYSTQEADGTLIGVVQLYGVEDVILRDLTCSHSKTICFHYANSINTHNDNLVFDNHVVGQVQQGGLQYSGPNSQITINNLRGTTQDDFIALNADDADFVNPPFVGLGPYITKGAITDVVIANLQAVNVYEVLRLLSDTSRIDRIKVSNVTATVFQSFFSTDAVGLTPGNIGTVEINGAHISTTPQLYAGVGGLFDLQNKCDRLVFTDIVAETLNDTRPITKISNNANIEYLDFNGLNVLENTTASAGIVPFNVAGVVRRLNLRNVKWLRYDTLPIDAGGFIQFTNDTGHIEELVLNNIELTRAKYFIKHFLGRLGTVLGSNILQTDAEGGATIVTSGTVSGAVTISNWFGIYSIPMFGNSKAKLGEAFAKDTTAPTFVSATAAIGLPIVTVTFSEPINSSNLAFGVTIKKNTVSQAIYTGILRTNATTVDYILPANIAGGDAVTFEYTGGNIVDWSYNPLATLTAQSATVSGAGAIYDNFDTGAGGLLSARTPSPKSAGFNWATFQGTSVNQFVAGNLKAELNSTTLATESANVDSGFATAIVSTVATMADYDVNYDGGVGITFRATDANNYWLYYVARSGTYLVKVVAGAPSTVASNTTRNYTYIPYRLQCNMAGNNIACTSNGAASLGIVDAFNNTATKHGIHARGGVALFDDFTVSQ